MCRPIQLDQGPPKSRCLVSSWDREIQQVCLLPNAVWRIREREVAVGFGDVLSKWKTLGRDEDVELAEAELEEFQKSHRQAYDNLDTDCSVLDSRRAKLLEYVLKKKRETRTGEDADPAIHVKHFCWGKQLKGRPRPEAQEAALGHVRKTEAFELASASGYYNSTGPHTEKDLGSPPTLGEILTMDLQRQQRELGFFQLSIHIMWSFFQPDSPQDPLDGFVPNASEFVRRLALPFARGKRLLYWVHKLDETQVARFPTALDAALTAEFRPGGKTQSEDGLPEVVHEPVYGRQLEQPIREAEDGP